VNRRSSLTAGQSFALLQSLATHKTSVFSPLLATGALSPGIRWQAGAGGVADRDEPLTRQLGPCPQLVNGSPCMSAACHAAALSYAPKLRSPAPQAW